MSVIAPTPFPAPRRHTPATLAADPPLRTARALATETSTGGERRRAARSCGPCTACCTAPSIPELDKPMDAPCRHLKAPRTTGAGACGASRGSATGGCADYDNRPTVCRAFLCGWRLGLGEKLDRPDLLGVMIQPTRRSDGAPMLAFVELRPGALDSRRAQALMVHWAAATGDGVTVRRAQSRHFMTLPVTIERKPIR